MARALQFGSTVQGFTKPLDRLLILPGAIVSGAERMQKPMDVRIYGDDRFGYLHQCAGSAGESGSNTLARTRSIVKWLTAVPWKRSSIRAQAAR